MEDALVLARVAASVTVVHRRDTFRASKVLAQREDTTSLIEISRHFFVCLKEPFEKLGAV